MPGAEVGPGCTVRRCDETQAFCWRTRCLWEGRAGLPCPCWTPAPRREGGQARGIRAGSWAGGCTVGWSPSRAPTPRSSEAQGCPWAGPPEHFAQPPAPPALLLVLASLPRSRCLAQHLQCPKSIAFKVSRRREGLGRTEAPWECRGIWRGHSPRCLLPVEPDLCSYLPNHGQRCGPA